MTQRFYVSGFVRRGGGRIAEPLGNPLFVYFVLHLCAGLSLTGGGMWPRPGRYVMRGQYTETVGTFGGLMNPFKCVWVR